MVGQIFFKHAMSGREGEQGVEAAPAVVAMAAVEFFLWTGLLRKFDLSYLYPFDGLNRVVVMRRVHLPEGEDDAEPMGGRNADLRRHIARIPQLGPRGQRWARQMMRMARSLTRAAWAGSTRRSRG